MNQIVPQMQLGQPRLMDFAIAPEAIFSEMRFELWMDNGLVVPPSARGLGRLKVRLQA